MAKSIYPLTVEYIKNKKPIDKDFVDRYIKIYDTNFSAWANELDYIFANRYIITDRREDFSFFRKNFSSVYSYKSEFPITSNGIDRLKKTPVTKIVIVSLNNNDKLRMIKDSFSELSNWKYDAENEFIYIVSLKDKTKLIVVNSLKNNLEILFAKKFKEGKIID